MVIKTNELERILGVTRKTLSEYVKAGMPKKTHGQFDAEQSLKWWRENVASDGNPEIIDSKKIYWKARAERERLAADQESGNYILAVDVEKAAFDAGLQIRESLEGIPVRLAPLLAVESGRFECQQILEKEIFNVLNNLSDILAVKAQCDA
ncbi:MAG: hypothetical protein WA081_05420 [Desulfosalsimonadaceae bacterium]